ncbi:MAG TPA: CNNM domain-containing protein [Xanthobacteraceae bacterium]|nr:CNNM domain-containing protein [Xanthobacteraceae bacterium]
MTPADWLALVVVIPCLLLSAVLAGAEAALAACSRARMYRLEKKGSSEAACVIRLLDAPRRTLDAIMLGSNLMKIAAVALVVATMDMHFGPWGMVGGVAAVTLLIGVSEVLPRMAALAAPERMAMRLAGPVAALANVATPIHDAARRVAECLLRLAGFRGEPAATVRAADSPAAAASLLVRKTEGVDRDMLAGVLALRELTVGDVMIHRTEMITANADLPPAALVREVLAASVTRVPLWRGTPENIVGVVHAKDLVRAVQAADGDFDKVDIAAASRAPWFVPDLRPLDEQLKAFRRRRTPLALVVDEYGEVMGLVTLEDILEEIVGDIADEYDVEVPGLRTHPDGSVTVDGGVPIRDLNRAMHWRMPDEEATTVAGLVIHEARLIPEPGQIFTFHGYRFRVLRKDRNRLMALRVNPPEPPPS